MTKPSDQKFLGIQVLRAIAACLVVITHSTFYAYERLDKGMRVWERGTRGVDVFFVISGFVMVYSSQKLLAMPQGWKIFAEHRIMRIVPLYWIVTTLKVAILLMTAGLALHTKLSLSTAACSYLFLPARNLDGKLEPIVGVGWTLNFEMLFYFVFAVALFLRISVYRLVGIVLAILSIAAFFREPSWPPAAFYLNSIVLEFYLGMLIAKVCLNGFHIPKRAAYWLALAGFIFLLIPPTAVDIPKVVISGLPAGLIIWSAASLEEETDAIPRFVFYLGDASYAIYLVHSFVSPLPPALFHRMHLDYPSISVCLSVVLGVSAGCILHQIIERPMKTRLGILVSSWEKPKEVAA